MTRVPALDGIRAIAVLAVVAFHSGALPLVSGAFKGVDVFFVLSGFLITAILAAERDSSGRIDLVRFYLRRCFRLLPALFLMLAAYVLIAPFAWPAQSAAAHARDAGILALFAADYVAAYTQLCAYLRHGWSLAVEEHFYIVWPLVLLAVLQRRSPLRVILWATAAAYVWQAMNFAWGQWDAAYYRFDTRAGGLLLGAAVALWVRERPQAEIAVPAYAVPALVVLMLASLSMGHWGDPVSGIFGIVLTQVLTAALIAVLTLKPASGGEHRTLLASAPMCWIGTMSYGIYLWHYPISRVTREVLPFWQSFLVCALLSSLLAWLSWHSVEAWGRKARARMDRAREPASQALA